MSHSTFKTQSQSSNESSNKFCDSPSMYRKNVVQHFFNQMIEIIIKDVRVIAEPVGETNKKCFYSAEIITEKKQKENIYEDNLINNNSINTSFRVIPTVKKSSSYKKLESISEERLVSNLLLKCLR